MRGKIKRALAGLFVLLLIVVAVIVSELKTKGQKAVELAEALEEERQG